MQSGNASPRRLVVGTAGHVDHGKTALIAALTGTDCDRLAEEKQRGLTIDLGFAHLDLGEFFLGIVDVPGHERFVKNMLAGAAGIDVAMLVVAADDAVMPQTREHLAILQLLGVQQGVVVISKADRVDGAWIEMVEEEVRSLVRGTFLEKAPLVRTAVPPAGSAEGPAETSVQGIEALRQALVAACRCVAPRNVRAPFRLPIDRGFTVTGQGAVVTGTVWSGSLKVGDPLEWLPSGRTLHVRGLQSHGRSVEQLGCGQRGAVNLSGVDYRELQRGQELATPGFLKPSRLLTVELEVIADSPRAIKHRSRQRIHLGTQEVMGTIELLEEVSCLEPGRRMLAQVHCAKEVMAVAGQPFIVRAESPLVTIGGGKVLQPCAMRISRRQPAHITRINALRSADPVRRAATAIYFYGGHSWSEYDLCRDAAVALEEVCPILDRLIESENVTEAAHGGSAKLAVHRDVLNEVATAVQRIVAKQHDKSPLQPMLPKSQILAVCQGRYVPEVVEHVLDRLRRDGVLRGDGERIALASFTPSLTAAQQELSEALMRALREGGPLPPDVKELAKNIATDEKEIRRIFNLLTAEGETVRLSDDIYLHADIFKDICSTLRQHFATAAGMTVSQIRDAIGTSRKYAVPLCEYLDRVGFTRRQGDLRVPYYDKTGSSSEKKESNRWGHGR